MIDDSPTSVLHNYFFDDKHLFSQKHDCVKSPQHASPPKHPLYQKTKVGPPPIILPPLDHKYRPPTKYQSDTVDNKRQQQESHLHNRQGKRKTHRRTNTCVGFDMALICEPEEKLSNEPITNNNDQEKKKKKTLKRKTHRRHTPLLFIGNSTEPPSASITTILTDGTIDVGVGQLIASMPSMLSGTVNTAIMYDENYHDDHSTPKTSNMRRIRRERMHEDSPFGLTSSMDGRSVLGQLFPNTSSSSLYGSSLVEDEDEDGGGNLFSNGYQERNGALMSFSGKTIENRNDLEF